MSSCRLMGQLEPAFAEVMAPLACRALVEACRYWTLATATAVWVGVRGGP